MSIPTHNLYDFVHQVTEKKFFLLYFYPWGSRDLDNLISYQTNNESLNSSDGIPVDYQFDFQKFNIDAPIKKLTYALLRWTQPILFCHDQEPLKFKLYTADSNLINNFSKLPPKFNHLLLKKAIPYSIHKKSVLLHSEINSEELKKFEDSNLFVGAYWWSHAIIARDWYRYAEHDLSLFNKPSADKKLFLAYCRRIDNTSAYRQTFLDQLYAYKLDNNCLISTKSNSEKISSNSSAEYNSDDFVNTSISVVLETTFDHRIHLTEKTLRPIACGHPFIIANGPGCLKLLRHYGFKTFHPYINESYDNIVDDSERLSLIVEEMKRLSLLDKKELDQLLKSCQHIVEHNKHLFFSKDFISKITLELKENVDTAFSRCKDQYYIEPWLDLFNERRQQRKAKIPVTKNVEKLIMFKLIKQLRQLKN
jgi:hypothetical protein